MTHAVAVAGRERSATNWLALAIGVAAALRLLTLGLYPVSDTTESRYAEISRKMVELGDWVTPWYDYGVPFWGKPPLSTWLTAGSMQLFGVSEWAARLPHFLCAVAVAWLIWDWLRPHGLRLAQLALALLSGSILYFVSAGAVMTDMALLIGVVMAMRGFWLGLHGTEAVSRRERWLLFVGLGMGLLAKGPIALVLAGGPMVVWAIATRNVGAAVRRLPWLRGSLLMFAIAIPWYALAERQTPGFLNYFLIGEHWNRFTQSGWAGDRYGSAHTEIRGTIWLFALVACLPWSVLLPFLAIGRKRNAAPPGLEVGFAWYLAAWALMPCVFFTAAGNLVWTYVLPGLPAASMLGAIWLARDGRAQRVDSLVSFGTLLTSLLFTAAVVFQPALAAPRSAKDVVRAFEVHRLPANRLVFVGAHQHSAAFYTAGKARILSSEDELAAVARSPAGTGTFLALRDDQWKRLSPVISGYVRDEGRFGPYRLLEVRVRDAQSVP